MSLTLDPEIAAALALMGEAGFTPPPVGDIKGGGEAGFTPPPVGDITGAARCGGRSSAPRRRTSRCRMT
jgi:hypothetical protein